MERPLRIAVFHDLPSGGAKRALHMQVRELVARGHRVDCYVTSTADEAFLPLRDVAHEVHVVPLPDPPQRERLLGGRPTPADLYRALRLFRHLPAAGREVARSVDAGRYDVLVVHPSQYTQAPHVLRFVTLPTIYYCQEVLRAAYEPLISSAPVRLAIRQTLGRIDRKNARSATVLVANSAYSGEQIRAVYDRDVVVAPPGVDLTRFRPVDGARGDYLLAVGALHPLKGIPFLLEAMARVPQGIRPRLVVVSDRARRAERARVLERAKELGLELELRERVSESELVRLYGEARAVLAASYREPLGLVPLEAMACGTPVVAVAEGGMMETVVDGETGLLVRRDPAELARGVQVLLDDPAEAERMGRNGRRHVESEWGWDRCTDRLIDLLRATAAAA